MIFKSTLQHFCVLYLNAISFRWQHFIPEAALRAWWGVCLLPVLGSCYNLACNCCCPSCRSSQHALSAACTWTTVCKCPLTGTYINQNTDDEFVILEWPPFIHSDVYFSPLAFRLGRKPFRTSSPVCYSHMTWTGPPCETNTWVENFNTTYFSCKMSTAKNYARIWISNPSKHINYCI